MANFNPSNFLYHIKNIVTGLNGDSIDAAGQSGLGGTAQSADGGIKQDVPYCLNDVMLLGANTTIALTGTMATLVTAGSPTSPNIGHIGIMVPRDYDEASDNFKIRLVAALGNSTDTATTLSGNSTILFPNTGNVTQTTGIVAIDHLQFYTGNQSIGTPLSTAGQVLELNFSGQGLVRDAVVDVLLYYSGNTAVGNATIYGIQYHYDSTIVSYNDTTNADDIGSTQTGVAGTLTGYGMPLR